jgi:magnesium-protoporphyrin IX monomethyl ester (oxidative) cyclase
MQRLNRISEGMAEAKAKGGVLGGLRRVGLSAAAAATFLRALVRRPRRHDLPADARLSPAW